MEQINTSTLQVRTTAHSAAVHSIIYKPLDREMTLVLPSEAAHNTDPSYSGNCIFPFAGRIEGALFDGIRLDRNDGTNSLHGGREAKKAIFTTTSLQEDAVCYSLHREAGEDQLPVPRNYSVRYFVDGSSLLIDLSMEAPAPVLCDMTCHLYLNPNGKGCIDNCQIKADASKVVINKEDHTSKEIIPVEGTCFDLRTWKSLGTVIADPAITFSHGLNNAFLLDKGGAVCLKNDDLIITCRSDSEGMVIYSGGYLEQPSSFIALEAQSLPIDCHRPVTRHFHRTIRFDFEEIR